MLLFFLFFLIFLYINFFLKKNKILLDKIDIQNHKSFSSNNSPPLTGGLFLIFYFLFFTDDANLYFQIFLILIFLNGLISDTDVLDSPNIRFFLQFIFVLYFVYLLDLRIIGIGIEIIDYYFSNKYTNYLFTIFCILILINGFNFIDGLNTLAFGYFLIVLFNLIFIEYKYSYEFNLLNDYKSIIFLFLLYLLILNGKLFLGDSGSYILGLFLGVKIIFINKLYPEISAWYFALLLWYPAFEILFSILRKFLNKKSPLKPDSEHLHQGIFLKIKSIFSNKYANPITANLINIYNLFTLFLGSLFIFDSKKIVAIILFNLIFYILIFNRCKKLNVKN